MDRREFTAGILAIPCAGMARSGLNESDAAAGVRAALERGALAAVALLGRTDGFLGNPKVRIPLPAYLNEAARLLRATGQQHRVEALETAMNRAAEAAVPEARLLFVSTAKAMSIDDALHVVRAGPTAVTDFFAAKTRASLTEKFLPIVTRATDKLDLTKRYDAVASRAAGLGLVRGDEASVQRYVTGRALSGLYLMIGEEERKMRADPLKTGSGILGKVFGS